MFTTADSEEFVANYDISSDGSSIYAVGNRTETQSTVAKFDGNSGDLVWSITIGSTYHGGTIASDGNLWVAANENPGTETQNWSDLQVWLLKIDPKTGEIVQKVSVRSGDLTPRTGVDDKLWLQNALKEFFEVVDLEAGTIDDHDEVLSKFAVSDISSSPVFIGDDLWLVDATTQSLLRFSVDKRELADDIDLSIFMSYEVEYRDGLIWVVERPLGAKSIAGQFVRSFDPETLELSEPTAYYESPYRTLETDNYTFDQTAENQITQIDNTTGETIQTLEGNNPRFLIGDKLWLEGLTFVTIEN